MARLLLITGLAACGRLGAGDDAPEADGLSLSFEDEPAPGVFLIEAPAERDTPGGEAGLWAVVPDLARPERAEAVNLDTGESVALALYRANRNGATIRLSHAAADALGVAAEPVKVRITALRRHPVVDTR